MTNNGGFCDQAKRCGAAFESRRGGSVRLALDPFGSVLSTPLRVTQCSLITQGKAEARGTPPPFYKINFTNKLSIFKKTSSESKPVPIEIFYKKPYKISI